MTKGLSRYHIMREVERSLNRLDTDHIDVYLVHNFDESTPIEETARALDDLVHQGKVRLYRVLQPFGHGKRAKPSGFNTH